MLSDPRSIAFVLDCIHAPLRHNPQALQSFFGKQAGVQALRYQNFALNPMGAQLTTIHGPASIPGSAAHSMLAFAPDRFQIKEEWPVLSLDDFVQRSNEVCKLVMSELAVPTILAVQCVVRSLVSVQGEADTRAFFDRQFFHVNEEDRRTFGRDPNLFGLRMVFPGTENDPALHNVRIESFNGDPRSIFLEETGVWSRPVGNDNLDLIEDSIRDAYGFLTRDVFLFVESRIAGAD